MAVQSCRETVSLIINARVHQLEASEVSLVGNKLKAKKNGKVICDFADE